MIYVTLERLVRQRPEVVWDYLTDLAALTSWVETLVEARTVDTDRPEAGTLLELVRRGTTKIERVVSEITAFRAPSLLALETRRGSMLMLDRASLTAVPEGTRLEIFVERTDQAERGRFFARAPGLRAETPAEHAIRDLYERSVDALVTRIERHSAAPYR